MNTTELIDRLRSAAGQDAFGPREVGRILADALAQDRHWLAPEHLRRDGRDWMLHPLFRCPAGRWSMLAAVFRPGVPVPVHDHGAWAVVGVYRGRECETRYRRLDDGSDPGRAKLEVDRMFVNPRGSVTVVPDGAIHTVQALDGHDAVSIHVYGTDIATQERSTYDLDRETAAPFRPDLG